jgi:hypothetical protein
METARLRLTQADCALILSEREGEQEDAVDSDSRCAWAVLTDPWELQLWLVMIMRARHYDIDFDIGDGGDDDDDWIW